MSEGDFQGWGTQLSSATRALCIASREVLTLAQRIVADLRGAQMDFVTIGEFRELAKALGVVRGCLDRISLLRDPVTSEDDWRSTQESLDLGSLPVHKREVLLVDGVEVDREAVLRDVFAHEPARFYALARDLAPGHSVLTFTGSVLSRPL